MPQFLVPAGEGRAVHIDAGTRFKIIDVEGGQVGDLFAFSANDTSEYASASHTRSIIKKLFPRGSDSIYTSRRRAILDLESDCSPGRHDSLFAACDPKRYESFGITSPHRSCATNLQESMAEYGGMCVPTPQPFNVFMEVAVDDNGGIGVSPATSQPGDYLSFRACIDTIVVLSSCPFDVYAISSGGVTPLMLEII